MKGYTPITTLKDFIYIYSAYKSDSEIAYLFDISENDIKAVREEFTKKTDDLQLKI
ncbi:hypothetical protein [Wukongibacter sp. M2B1]|uniref:hypothetical protein n=1 Tax=Wukongibacter sp. M2B1 TaxID=3088895 RepID=UPI003D790981